MSPTSNISKSRSSSASASTTDAAPAGAVERCDECGFDASRWTTRDAATFFHILELWWRRATDGIEPSVLNQRPAPAVWSALEYGGHSAVVTAMLRVGLEMAIADDDVQFPSFDLPPDAAPDDGARAYDVAGILGDIEREANAIAAMASEVKRPRASEVLFHAVHDASHHMFDVSRGLAALGAGAPRQQGTVAQVNASDGGVPKLPVPGGAITASGLAGDRQQNRKHHGRPFQALCLWSQEVLDELRADGHPIAPGSAGENITIAGIDWSTLRPGTLLGIGTALAEVSFPAVPCKQQTGWFTDGDFSRIAHENNPQWVRWYAWVREPGEVATGDDVVVRP